MGSLRSHRSLPETDNTTDGLAHGVCPLPRSRPPFPPWRLMAFVPRVLWLSRAGAQYSVLSHPLIEQNAHLTCTSVYNPAVNQKDNAKRIAPGMF